MREINGLNLIFHTIRLGGGMERYVLDVISEFASRDILVRVIARQVDWPGIKPNNVEFVVLSDRTPFSRLNNDLFEHRALQHIRKNWPTIGISRVTGKVNIAISGGTHIGHLLNKGKKATGYFDRRVIANENMLYGNAEKIITHSDQVRNEIINDYAIKPEKIETLYPPVDTRKFCLQERENRNQVRLQFGVKPDEFMLLFPSNDHVRKGGGFIVEALADFDSRIVLAVAGKSPLNHPKVINIGFSQNMPAIYAAADATILASEYEPFGLVGPESILCGTPVLLANTVGAVEVLSEPGCFPFSRTAEDLRIALTKILERFEVGNLNIIDPSLSIHYPYSLRAHVDSLIERL
jgi:glycosyltransferase involved in cell wall biosynthesis